jgi:hypothetical protein
MTMSENAESITPPHRFVSLRRQMITRFIIMITALTLVLGGIFFFLISPRIVASTQNRVIESMRAAGVDQAAIDEITAANEERYLRDIRIDIRNNVWLAIGVFFLVGLASIYGVTTVATRDIQELTAAARAIARGEYKQDLSRLYQGALRSEISELAEAVEESGRVHIREQVLIEKVRELEIKIDEAKMQEQVSEIADTEFFQELQNKAKSIRQSRKADGGTPTG